MKHTPGPWKIHDKLAHFVCAPDGSPIGCTGLRAGCTGEDEANQVLFAAAPELLEACAAMLEVEMMDMETPNFKDKYWKAVRSAVDAIRKARGEA